MGMLSSGTDWLITTLLATEGIPVTYRPAATGVAATIRAWAGQTDRLTLDRISGSAVLSSSERDYYIPRSELATEPSIGDRITESFDGDSITWEIAPATGLEPVRWADRQRKIWKVHCRRFS